MSNTDIGKPNATLLNGTEKSQLGNIVPGEQNKTFEGHSTCQSRDEFE
jgi:hypothetical protein